MTALFPARRLVIAAGFVVALAAPAVAALSTAPADAPTPLANCPAGEHVDTYSQACVPFLVPNSSGGGGSSLCPPGVSGAECGSLSGNMAQPHMPAPPPLQQPALSLMEVDTPGY